MSHPIYCPHCGTSPGYPGACQCNKPVVGIKATFKPMDPIEVDGWTEWVTPAQGYKMQCCDCGLVHEMEFRVFAETKQQSNGDYEIVEMPWPLRAMFRARRA